MLYIIYRYYKHILYFSLIIFFHLRLGLSGSFSPPCFQIRSQNAFLFSSELYNESSIFYACGLHYAAAVHRLQKINTCMSFANIYPV